MAKKLTNEVLQKLIMESIEEMGGLGEAYVQDFSRMGPQKAMTPFARKLSLPVARKLDSSNEVEDFLEMLASRDDIPDDIREYAEDLLYSSSGVTAKSGTETDWDLEELPDSSYIDDVEDDLKPTVDLSAPTVRMAAESKKLESLILKVLAEELSKKKEAPKQPKKPVKK